MGPKNKLKKNIKKGTEKEKPKKILKSEYLAKIAERNSVLAAARKRIQEVEDVYFATENKYEQTQEDMADILKYLQHEIQENELEIDSYNEKIEAYKIKTDENDKYYLPIISKMGTEYEEKEKRLQCQIQQNTAKLSAFDEVRQQREEYLRKKDQLCQKMREMKDRHQNEIYETEKEAIIKQDTMQKEVDSNLEQLVIDFMQASDIAIGETTNQLIRNNIILGNMLTCTQETFEMARESYQKLNELEKKYRYNAELLEEEHVIMVEKYIKQVNKIESLIKSHEEIRKKIKASEKLVKDNRRLQRQIAEKECILKEKLKKFHELKKMLSDQTDQFNSIKNDLDTLRRGVVSLEMCLYEAAKTVKHSLDIENVLRLPEEHTEEGTLEAEKGEREQEENLKEFRYKKRETDIEEVIEKLWNGLLIEVEIASVESSSEFHPLNDRESI